MDTSRCTLGWPLPWAIPSWLWNHGMTKKPPLGVEWRVKLADRKRVWVGVDMALVWSKHLVCGWIKVSQVDCHSVLGVLFYEQNKRTQRAAKSSSVKCGLPTVFAKTYCVHVDINCKCRDEQYGTGPLCLFIVVSRSISFVWNMKPNPAPALNMSIRRFTLTRYIIRNPALQQNSKQTTAHSFGPVWIFKIRDVTSKLDEKLLQPWARTERSILRSSSSGSAHVNPPRDHCCSDTSRMPSPNSWGLLLLLLNPQKSRDFPQNLIPKSRTQFFPNFSPIDPPRFPTHPPVTFAGLPTGASSAPRCVLHIPRPDVFVAPRGRNPTWPAPAAACHWWVS